MTARLIEAKQEVRGTAVLHVEIEQRTWCLTRRRRAFVYRRYGPHEFRVLPSDHRVTDPRLRVRLEDVYREWAERRELRLEVEKAARRAAGKLG